VKLILAEWGFEKWQYQNIEHQKHGHGEEERRI
jgi:hypothetical protein